MPWILVKAWILPLPETVQEQLNEGINYGFDGMIVYVDQAGKPPEFYAAGWHNRKNKIPAYPQALFKIASITKLYVAVATTKLVKDGRLSLDKKLAEYFPELAGRIEYSDKITCINHRVSSEEECEIMLIENKTTAHTGDVKSEITKSIDDQKHIYQW